MENPIKMDDLGVPLFLETPIWSETKSKTFWFLCRGQNSYWDVQLEICDDRQYVGEALTCFASPLASFASRFIFSRLFPSTKWNNWNDTNMYQKTRKNWEILLPLCTLNLWIWKEEIEAVDTSEARKPETGQRKTDKRNTRGFQGNRRNN